MKKLSSLLDYSYPGLCPNVYMQDGTLNPAIRDFVFKLLNSFYNSYGFKNPEAWVLDVTNIGSLTTNKYVRQSDFDCHVLVDINKFIETNMPKASVDEGLEALDEARKEWDRAKILLPFGEHALELFFEDPNVNPSSTSNCGRYSLMTDTWLKEPIFFAQDLDWEEKKKQVIEEAKEMAGEIDKSFGQIRRDIQSIDELKEVMQAWPKETRQLYLNKIQKKLDSIEEEIENTIAIKEDIVNERHSQHDLLSDTEIKFKYLGRYFYFSLINDLKAIMGENGVSVEELPLIEKVISEASLSKESLDRGNSAWIAPDGTVFSLRDEKVATHADWLDKNYNWLHKKYGFTIDNSQGDYDDYDPASFCGMLVAEGWSRVGDIENINGTGVEVSDLHNIPNAVFDFILSNLNNPKEKITLEDSDGNYITLNQEELVEGQKAVNKALSNKRLTASLTPKEEKTILIDFDGTLVTENPDGSIGNLIEGSKEALQKLKELGNIVEIYSCRANTEKGLDEVKEWLDNNQVPYDSIFIGEKPCSRLIIDNSAIKFDNWADVLKQVEKSEKKASLYIIADSRYWVDPSGKVYSVKDTHEDWLFENKDLLQKQYGYVEDTAGQSWWDIKTENLLRQLLQDGWLRVGDLFNISGEGSNYGKHFLGQGIEIADINRAPDSLFNFISNFGPDKYFLIEDLRRRHVEVSVEELMADGQEAINRALQRKNMVHASFDLQTIDPKTFKRTEPYALFIGTSNYGKAGKFDMFNVYGQHPMITESNQLPTVGLETLVKENIPIIGKEPRAGDKQPAQDISSVYKTSRLFSKKEIKAQIESNYDYSSTQFNLPKELSEKIIRWAIETIPEDQLFYDEDPTTHGIQLESHITLKYGLLTDSFEEIEQALKGEKAPKIKFGKTSFFEPEGKDYDVVIIQVESSDLQKLNKKLCDAVEHEDLQGNEYHPHATVAYVARGKGKEFSDKDILNGEEITVDVLTFSPKMGDKQSLELEKNKKEAWAGNISLWLAPDGEEFPIGQSSHSAWVDAHKEVLKTKYNINLETAGQMWPLIKAGWIRVDGYLPTELDLHMADINNIPQAAEQFVWKYKPEVVIVEDLNGKDTSFDREEYSKGMMKQASGNNFLPSLVQAPNNEWQFQHGGDDLQIGVDPDPISDESTWYAPCTEGKPRSKEVWRKFISIFDHPISKKDTDKVSAYDPELEEAEANSMGEETLLEYSKGFYDPKKHDFPKNTTWLNTTYQDQEPSKPLPVTYSPKSDSGLLNQNSPDGFPWRFYGPIHGQWFTDQGEIIPALENMEKYKESAINSLTREITAAQESGGWISPEGEYIPTEDHLGYISNHPEVFGFKPEQVTSLKEADILMKIAIQNGWVTIRKWGDILAIVANSYYDARKAENEIFNMASQVKLIRIDTLDKQVFSAKINDFMEQKWGAFLKQPVMAKQAGSYSSTYTDEQGAEMFNDQHQNDEDQIPYTNFDQRGIDFGMHDSPENTDSGIGWPQDENRYTVYLDQIENPADRNFPPGLMNYDVEIYYNSAPASDGIEQMNP